MLRMSGEPPSRPTVSSAARVGWATVTLVLINRATR